MAIHPNTRGRSKLQDVRKVRGQTRLTKKRVVLQCLSPLPFPSGNLLPTFGVALQQNGWCDGMQAREKT